MRFIRKLNLALLLGHLFIASTGPIFTKIVMCD